jgi:hypothetical protein
MTLEPLRLQGYREENIDIVTTILTIKKAI